MNPTTIYNEIVTIDSIRSMRAQSGCFLSEAKRYHERQAFAKILKDSDCSPGVRFILERMIANYR